jgi:phage terminase large subunit-like protein
MVPGVANRSIGSPRKGLLAERSRTRWSSSRHICVAGNGAITYKFAVESPG